MNEMIKPGLMFVSDSKLFQVMERLKEDKIKVPCLVSDPESNSEIPVIEIKLRMFDENTLNNLFDKRVKVTEKEMFDKFGRGISEGRFLAD